MEAITYLSWGYSLAGGVLIGLAATLLLLFTGRIAGVSGIAGGLLFSPKSELIWRAFFLFGLILGAMLIYAFLGNAPAARTTFPSWLLALAGLLVGFGTSLGSGCTSGHGVCGIGLLSVRSLIATLIFMITAVISTFILRHMSGVF